MRGLRSGTADKLGWLVPPGTDLPMVTSFTHSTTHSTVPIMTIIIPTMPVESPEKAVLAQPEQESVLIAHPAESLILENRDGQWVRIPTGTHLPISPGAEVSGPSDAAFRPPIKLPPTVLVFRDGHQEEVQRYVVQGTDLYNGADYWSSGTWTRRIPIAELDVPTSLKVNAARGGNFSLPTRSYEVIVRF